MTCTLRTGPGGRIALAVNKYLFSQFMGLFVNETMSWLVIKFAISELLLLHTIPNWYGINKYD